MEKARRVKAPIVHLEPQTETDPQFLPLSMRFVTITLAQMHPS